jgi:hypothetical protein
MYSRYANELVLSLMNDPINLKKQTEAFVPNLAVSLSCMVQLIINLCDRYTGPLIMAVTYGHLENEASFLSRAHELLYIAKHIVSTEKAAMFTAFPFRECLCRRHNFEYSA